MTIECALCGKATPNKKYCSRSCAVTVNNSSKPKRKAKHTYVCACGNKKHMTSAQCKKCYKEQLASKTLEDLLYRKGEKQNLYGVVRAQARYYLKQFVQECQVCGYANHVQACHIEPVSSFGEKTLINVINSDSNLLLLCPNHHWEFDHGGIQGEINERTKK